MSSEAIITVENLGKKYSLRHQGDGRYIALRDVLTDKAKSLFRRPNDLVSDNGSPAPASHEDFWALKDVSFEVKQGEVLGIIGRNGAGKSTLLKILSRITDPTEGRVRIRGRVASLLEVGTGFHPELTGRENVYLNGAILGMGRSEIKAKFDEIVAFAEVERFLDTPVKRYSSGMYVRLAFAVAAHLEPEILVVDEVLAVGDADFQRKCLGKMRDVSSKHGRTVLFVSHNMGAIKALTGNSLHLDRGRVIDSGPSVAVVTRYLAKSFSDTALLGAGLDTYRRDLNEEKAVRIVRIGIYGYPDDAEMLTIVKLGTEVSVEVRLEAFRSLAGVHVTLSIKNSEGARVITLTSWDLESAFDFAPGLHNVIARLDGLCLSPGNYFVDVGIDASVESPALDAVLDVPFCTVVNDGRIAHWPNRPWGVVHFNSTMWEIT